MTSFYIYVMQTITATGPSDVIYYLGKVSTYTDAVYELVMEDLNDKVTTTVRPVDISPSPEHYNKFVLTNGLPYDREEGEFDLSSGVYGVTIYEYEPSYTEEPRVIHKGEIKIEGVVRPTLVEFTEQPGIKYFEG